MPAIYNEHDPFAARWLRGLIAAGHIAPGVVDERSVTRLGPVDVVGAGQRHFFAGIGGWSAALRLAGVRDDADIWTGSCPCQPFSDAGRKRGTDDDRHLWPTWFSLIRECHPAVVLGEQVASRAGLGWLDAVFADLEGAGYACAAADLPAAGVGAPHKRQRLFFVAYANGVPRGLLETEREPRRGDAQARGHREAGGLADGERAGLEVVGEQQARRELEAAERGSATRCVADADRGGQRQGLGHVPSRREQPDAARSRETRGVADAGQDERRSPGAGGSEREDPAVGAQGAVHDQPRSGDHRAVANAARSGRLERVDDGQPQRQRSGSAHGGWSNCDWIPCSDGVSRPTEPGTHPLVDGLRGRVGLLRGYGNAIVPQVAAAFIRAALSL